MPLLPSITLPDLFALGQTVWKWVEVPKFFGTLGPHPLGWEHGWLHKNTPLPMCYTAKLGHSRSNIIMEIAWKNGPLALYLSRSSELTPNNRLPTFHSNHGLYHTVSKINDDFSWKLQIFPTHIYLMLPLSGFALELGNIGYPKETKMMELSGPDYIWRAPWKNRIRSTTMKLK